MPFSHCNSPNMYTNSFWGESEILAILLLTARAALLISWFTYKPSSYVLFSGIAIYSMADELFGEYSFIPIADHFWSLPWYLTLRQVFGSLITHGTGHEIATKQGVTASHAILSGSYKYCPLPPAIFHLQLNAHCSL